MRALAILSTLLALVPATAGAQCDETAVTTCRDEAAAHRAAGDYARALALLHRGCGADDARACASLVEILSLAPEARATVSGLAPLLVARCAGGDDLVCAQLGRDTFDDLDRLRRSRPARAALHAACSCMRPSHTHDSPSPASQPRTRSGVAALASLGAMARPSRPQPIPSPSRHASP